MFAGVTPGNCLSIEPGLSHLQRTLPDQHVREPDHMLKGR
jgi:hypothetical protein